MRQTPRAPVGTEAMLQLNDHSEEVTGSQFINQEQLLAN